MYDLDSNICGVLYREKLLGSKWHGPKLTTHHMGWTKLLQQLQKSRASCELTNSMHFQNFFVKDIHAKTHARILTIFINKYKL